MYPSRSPNEVTRDGWVGWRRTKSIVRRRVRSGTDTRKVLHSACDMANLKTCIQVQAIGTRSGACPWCERWPAPPRRKSHLVRFLLLRHSGQNLDFLKGNTDAM